MKSVEEKRSHRRHEVELAATYCVQDIGPKEAVVSSGLGQLRDVSYGGIRFHAAGIAPDTLRSLELDRLRITVVVMLNGKKAEIRGRVVWSRRIDDQTVGLGLRFITMDDENVKLLMAWVRSETKPTVPLTLIGPAIMGLAAIACLVLWRMETSNAKRLAEKLDQTKMELARCLREASLDEEAGGGVQECKARLRRCERENRAPGAMGSSGAAASAPGPDAAVGAEAAGATAR
ncbi:MAG: PilZ domain-containing protein [Polyangiaceae bacterium]|jgi:hypothetical protein|nr:PilZ domain-containing protein [Polyangiaceae bacterium]